MRLKLEPEARRRLVRRIGTERRLLDQFIQFIQVMPVGIKLHQIQTTDLLEYRKTRVMAGLKPDTVDTELARIRAILKKAADLFPGFELKLEFPPRLARKRERRQRVLSHSELAAIQEAARETRSVRRNSHAALCLDLFILLRDSGLRIGDAIMLQRRAVHLEREIGLPFGSIRMTSAKTGGPILIPISEQLGAILERRMKSTRGEYLFYTGGSLDGQAVRFNCWLKTWAEAAGCLVDGSGEEVTAHHLRHSFVTHALEDGAPLPAVMAMTGHTSKTMVMEYSHPTPKQLSMAQRVISGWSAQASISNPSAIRRRVAQVHTYKTGGGR